MLCFIVLFLAIIPFATFNIGIALRQKWVVLVVIFVLLTSAKENMSKNKKILILGASGEIAQNFIYNFFNKKFNIV